MIRQTAKWLRIAFGLSRQQARLEARRFEGAGGGRRFAGRPSHGPENAEILAALSTLRGRAGYFAANNAWVANGVSAWVSALVGAEIRAASGHPDPEVRKVIQRLFEAWKAQADADGLHSFPSLLAVAVRQMIIAGECFALLITTPAGLRIRLIDPDLVDVSDTRELGGGRRIVAGIEFDADGTRVAYHVLRRRPTDRFASSYGERERIPAADVIHLFNPIAPGQVRGLTWLASILLRLSELDKLEDAQLLRQQIAAMFAVFFTDTNGTATYNPFEGLQTGSVLDSGLEPGTAKFVPSGWDVKTATPIEGQQSVEYIRLQLRAIAAGLGVPEHLLTGDLSQVNYSSIRAALVEFRRRVDAIQYNVVIHQFCRPIWERFITLAVLSGDLIAPDFESRMADYLAVEFYPPAAEWVDPLKDAQAEALAVASGFKSRRQVVAERGYSVEDLDAEIAADRAREISLNLSFAGGTAAPKGDPNA